MLDQGLPVHIVAAWHGHDQRLASTKFFERIGGILSGNSTQPAARRRAASAPVPRGATSIRRTASGNSFGPPATGSRSANVAVIHVAVVGR